MSLYYLVPRFPTATFDVGSRLGAITSECVIPENIHTPPSPHTPTPTPTHTTEIPRGGGSKRRPFLRGGGGAGGGGVASREFFPGSPCKIDELLKTNSCSVEQAISYLTVNSFLKQ